MTLLKNLPWQKRLVLFITGGQFGVSVYAVQLFKAEKGPETRVVIYVPAIQPSTNRRGQPGHVFSARIAHQCKVGANWKGVLTIHRNGRTFITTDTGMKIEARPETQSRSN